MPKLRSILSLAGTSFGSHLCSMKEPMQHISVLIIGGGPTGLTCGIAAQALNIDYKILEKGCLVNSLYNFPTDMTFFSSSDRLEIGGLPFTSLALRPSRHEALEYYRRVTQRFDLNIGFYETFERLEAPLGPGRYKVRTSKAVYTCDFIVNATGFYDTPVLMNIPGEGLPKVKHYFTSAHHLYQQKVAVVGASNSAVDVALEAYRKGAEVTLLVRGKSISDSVKYWVRPDVEARIREGNIRVFYQAQVQEITPGYVLFSQQGKQVTLENDFLYAMTGYLPNFDLSRSLGVEIEEATGQPTYDPDTMETNAAGVYVAGVVCGGYNTRKWFIENSRDHGHKIMQHIHKQGLASA